jgi:H2-forming N5,N10-methylenetetrahydromethanopterin dehydrogenase-like enzyme
MAIDPLPSLPWYWKMILTAGLTGLITVYTNNKLIEKTTSASDAQAFTQKVNDLEVKQQTLQAHQEMDHQTLQEIKQSTMQSNDKLDHLLFELLGEKSGRNGNR